MKGVCKSLFAFVILRKGKIALSSDFAAVLFRISESSCLLIREIKWQCFEFGKH